MNSRVFEMDGTTILAAQSTRGASGQRGGVEHETD